MSLVVLRYVLSWCDVDFYDISGFQRDDLRMLMNGDDLEENQELLIKMVFIGLGLGLGVGRNIFMCLIGWSY